MRYPISPSSPSASAKMNWAISGTASALAVPWMVIVLDTAQFSFGVSEDAKTPNEAQAKVTAKMNPIIDKLKSMGVAEKDIKTTDYQIYPKYDYTYQPCPLNRPCMQTQQQTLVGYTESHNIMVKVRQVAKAGDVIAAVTALGVNNVSG